MSNVVLPAPRKPESTAAGIDERPGYGQCSRRTSSLDPSHTASEARRRPSRAEAEAAVLTLIEWAGDDPDRLVEVFAKRMQIQEALTSQIADTIQEVLEPRGVGVVIEAAHQCMTTRGIRKPGVSMVTSRMLGSFRDDRTTRREFLSVIGSHGSPLHES